MKKICSLILVSLFFITSKGQMTTQDNIEPGRKTLNINYFRPRSVFQKLTWLDKEGRLRGDCERERNNCQPQCAPFVSNGERSLAG